MKRVYIYLGIALVACLNSCTDDSLDNGVKNPVHTGDEILFGSTLSDNANMIETRTVYGDRTDTGVPVYWEDDGSDEIAIFCLQSSQPADHLVKYNVTPETEDLNNDGKPDKHQAASVTKVNTAEAGLQWGDSDTPHNFYAFYPASAVKGSEEENQTGKITANIPETQQVTEWRIKEGTEDGAINGHKTYFGLPNMDYAYMYAYTQVTPKDVDAENPVNLKFKNLVTVLDITVQGPETGEMTVTNINVDAVDGNIILTGDFTCNIRAAESNSEEVTATCEAVENTGSSTVRNRISIPCYDKINNEFITLQAGEYLNVKAYIIPDDDENHIIHPRQLKITVATLNGAAKVKTLSTADVTPHKINRVILPPLVEGGINYWMSNLDSDIYLSELSLPGSKMSFTTTNNVTDGGNVFQGVGLEKQFEDGVRAFVIQTSVTTQYSQYGNQVTGADVTELYSKTSLEDILDDIATLLQQNNGSEYAFVQITYDNASSNSDKAGGAFQYWIEGIEYKLNQLKNNDKYNIYTDQITPDTKLGDVRGHIVLKVNYNVTKDDYGNITADMSDYIDASATIPALFSTWTKGMDDVDLYWGSPKPYTGRPEMHWYYSEATHIGNSNEAADLDTKKNQISTVFQESVDKYIDGTGHNYWFMNDIGGCYSTDYPGRTTIPVLTTDLNNYAVQLLQERTQNASLGIVLLNYADKQADSGAKYQSDWLIQTIIDNNFKFALRKASSTTNNAASSDASYTSGGSVIK